MTKLKANCKGGHVETVQEENTQVTGHFLKKIIHTFKGSWKIKQMK